MGYNKPEPRFQPQSGDRMLLNFSDRELLETKVLPTARRWLGISGLRDHGEATLKFWGESIPPRSGGAA